MYVAGPRARKNLQQAWLLGLLATSLLLASCGRRATADAGNGSSAEPDKILYEQAMENIKDGKSEVGRLTLQTLMNTYPESEYLAKAKLAIADSYYQDGGSSGLLQSVAEYQDFITFFPFLDEAAYAQLQIGMAHYHRMEKPDRDRTEAMAAEAALQLFLQKYPDSPEAAEGRQRLREVQEVLAEGDFRIASFYYLRRGDKAAAARLQRLVNRYPLYSQADRAHWMLATVYARNEGGHDAAVQSYAHIVRDYPLSPLVEAAKTKLEEFGVPAPQPDSEALARMKQEAQAQRDRPGFFGRTMGMLKSSPDVSMAARIGTPTMTPADDPSLDELVPILPARDGAAGGAGSGTGVSVETVAPGQRSPAP